jgi:type III pantothenate kinase
MIFCADLGNTTVTLGVLDGPEIKGFWRITTGERTAEEYGVIIRSLLERASLEAMPDRAGMCSVVPSETDRFASAVAAVLSVEVFRVDGQGDWGIIVSTDNPAEVGGDRVANAVGAYCQYGGPCIVVDAGTATTYDYVSAEGEYCGGVIAPGILCGARDLWTRTRMLPAVEIRKPDTVIGRNTVDCMQSGIYYGSVSQVEGVVRRMWAELGTECPVVLTGGQAGMVHADLAFESVYDPHLTLKGIAFAIDPSLR